MQEALSGSAGQTSPEDAGMQWDTHDWRKLRDERLLSWLNGDIDAVATVVMLSTISETYDDLIDGDPVSPQQVHSTFIAATVGLQFNPFFKRWEQLIYGTVLAGLNAWLDSLELEKRDGEASRMHAFYLRNYLYELLNVCAFAVGGFDHMRAVSLEMRDFFTHETYNQWEHRHVALA
jgi:hypothetical protein